jgi:DNA-binding transcriptional ArsR family regulator
MTVTIPAPRDSRGHARARALRRRIMALVLERGEASPKELAQALDLPLANVSYHVKILREDGALAQRWTRPARGAVEHFYGVERVPLDMLADEAARFLTDTRRVSGAWKRDRDDLVRRLREALDA